VRSAPLFGFLPASAIRYAVVGLANTALGYSIIYAGMYFVGLGTVSANAIGYSAGFVMSFFLNRRITFRSKVKAVSAMPRFAVVNGIAYLANLATVLLLERVLGVDPYFAQAGGLFPYLAIGYLGSRYLVFSDATEASRVGGGQ